MVLRSGDFGAAAAVNRASAWSYFSWAYSFNAACRWRVQRFPTARPPVRPTTAPSIVSRGRARLADESSARLRDWLAVFSWRGRPMAQTPVRHVASLAR